MFNEPDFQLYYSQIDRIAAEKLNEERADYLLRVDPEEYLLGRGPSLIPGT